MFLMEMTTLQLTDHEISNTGELFSDEGLVQRRYASQCLRYTKSDLSSRKPLMATTYIAQPTDGISNISGETNRRQIRKKTPVGQRLARLPFKDLGRAYGN